MAKHRRKEGELAATAAAVLLEVSRERLVRLVQTGRLKGRRHPELGWLVSRAAVEQLQRERRAENQEPDAGGPHG